MFQCVWHRLVDIVQVLYRNLLGSSHLWFGSYFVGMTLNVGKISFTIAFSLFMKFLAKSGKVKENILEKSGKNFIKFLLLLFLNGNNNDTHVYYLLKMKL